MNSVNVDNKNPQLKTEDKVQKLGKNNDESGSRNTWDQSLLGFA